MSQLLLNHSQQRGESLTHGSEDEQTL